tara:strand:- start:2023 stop:2784 length:762 start_codon:yes stop_codon:yes gene_type:complete
MAPVTNKMLAQRVFPLESLEVRADDDAGPVIEGYAAVFDQLSEPLWFGMREKIRSGAFKKTIKEHDIRALMNHDPNFPLGRNKAGTLTLSEDDRGLHVVIQPPSTQWAQDLMVSMDRGDVNQMSFGFAPVRDEVKQTEPEVVIELQEVRLYDVSVVTFPAYPQTEVGLNSLFSSLGVEPDKVGLSLMKHARGLDLSSADTEQLITVRAVLDEVLASAPTQGSHPDDDNDDYPDHRRVFIDSLDRELQLLELEG